MNKIFLVLQPFFLQEQISNFLGRTNNKKKETNKQKIKKAYFKCGKWKNPFLKGKGERMLWKFRQ